MVDIGSNTNGYKRIPNSALKVADFVALTVNIMLVTLATIIGVVFLALLGGVPDFALYGNAGGFGLVSSIGLSAILIAPSVVIAVVITNIASFVMKTFNDSTRAWVFLISRGMRIVSAITALTIVTTLIFVLITLSTSNN